MMQWDPAVYLNFGDLRLRPGLELLQAIPREEPDTVYDLGCGPGNITPYLAARWPEASIVGIDNSAEMLARAQTAAPDHAFERHDIAEWQPARPAAVIYSNAALQWLGDHETLLPRLFATLAPGGVLAIQMPRNHQSPSHTTIVDVVEAHSARERLRPLLRRNRVAEPADYYALLSPLADQLTIWDTDYLQAMEGENPVADWTRGSALRPFLTALEDDRERAEFEADYRERVRRAYPPAADGRTLFPFRRIFILATRAAA